MFKRRYLVVQFPWFNLKSTSRGQIMDNFRFFFLFPFLRLQYLVRSSLHGWVKDTKQSILVDADGKLVKKKTEKLCIKKRKGGQKKYVVFIEYRLV